MRIPRILSLTILTAMMVAACWASEQPQFAGAKVIERSAKAGVQAAVAQITQADKGPAWIAYSVPVIAGEHHMCCYSSARTA